MKKKESALFFSYLCAHILQIAFLLLCFAIFAVILYLYDLPADPVLYAALLCAAVGLLSFILSYLRFHKQFRRLESALLNLPESRDDLPEPSGSTAVCYDEAVRMPVSYTHLDVYKRQRRRRVPGRRRIFRLSRRKRPAAVAAAKGFRHGAL